jgi:hypothetical protein
LAQRVVSSRGLRSTLQILAGKTGGKMREPRKEKQPAGPSSQSGILRKWKSARLAWILHQMQNPRRLNRITEPIRVADSPISGKCKLHFSDIGGASPEELLWQRPEQRFRPSGRIFREKCGLADQALRYLNENLGRNPQSKSFASQIKTSA